MKICSIKQEFYDLFDNSVELEKNPKRPCLIIVKLKYKGTDCNFAIPFRSNINGKANRKQYFPLPPRSTTKSGNKHGLHYIKMFPIKDQYINKYYFETEENKHIVNKVQKNLNLIISEAQQYIKDYENGTRHNYCTNIDVIFNEIYDTDDKQEVASDIDIKSKVTVNKEKSEISVT